MSQEVMAMNLPQAQSDTPDVVQFERIGVGAADPDMSQLALFLCQGASVASLAAVSDTANATLTLRMIYFNSTQLPCGSSPAITFTSATTPDFGALFAGLPSTETWRPSAGATSIGIKVDSVSGGRWSIHGTMG
jgi:hypothetical protein